MTEDEDEDEMDWARVLSGAGAMCTSTGPERACG